MKYDVEFISAMSKWNMIYSLCNCAIVQFKKSKQEKEGIFYFKVKAKIIIIINIHPMISLATGAT